MISQTKFFILTFIFISSVSIATSTGLIECAPASGQVPSDCDRLKRLLNNSNMRTVLGVEDATVKNIYTVFERTTFIGNYYSIKAATLVDGEEDKCCFSATQTPWTNRNAPLKVTCGQCHDCQCFKDV